MPYSSGTWTAPAADFPAVAGTLIESSKFNNIINDIASALTTCLLKDGSQTVTANIPFAGFALQNARLRAVDGLVGTPGITFESDLDCGWYRIGANNIALALNGAKVVDYLTTGIAITGTLSCTGNATIGDATGDAHAVNGATTITDDSNAGLTVVRSGGGDKIAIGGEAAGSGALVAVLNSGGTDYEPLVVTGEYLSVLARTGALTASEVGRFTSTGLNSCAVGATTASTGAFSTLSATGAVTLSATVTNTNSDNTSAAATHLKLQRGSGAGDDFDFITTGDTSNGVASLLGKIGATQVLKLTTTGINDTAVGITTAAASKFTKTYSSAGSATSAATNPGAATIFTLPADESDGAMYLAWATLSDAGGTSHSAYNIITANPGNGYSRTVVNHNAALFTFAETGGVGVYQVTNAHNDAISRPIKWGYIRFGP